MIKSPRTAVRSAIAATAIAAALVLSACSPSSDNASTSAPASGGGSGAGAASGEAVTVTLGTQTAQGGQGPSRSVVAEFEKANPNITVNLVETPTVAYAQVLRTQLQ